MKNCNGAQFVARIVWLAAAAFSITTMALAQSQPAASTPPQPQQDSVGEAARKAKKAKAQPGKVYTDEDVAGMPGTVSVVGQAGSGSSGLTEPGDSSVQQKKGGASKSGNDQEAFWRGKARPIREKMAAIDQAMDKLREDIKKSGGAGFDASSGLKQNVIYIEDRNGQLKNLEKKKQELQTQLDELEEVGRKAGALPAWFR